MISGAGSPEIIRTEVEINVPKQRKPQRNEHSRPAKPGKMPGRNGGTLNAGGTPGNSGGKKGRSGRRPSAMRALATEMFSERLPHLADIADGKAICRIKSGDAETETLISPDVSDRLRAIDLLGRYGPGTVKEVSADDVEDRVERTLEVIQARTSPEQFASIVEELRPIWR